MELDYYKILGVNIWDDPDTYNEKFKFKKEQIKLEFLERESQLYDLILDIYLAIKNKKVDSNLLAKTNTTNYDEFFKKFKSVKNISLKDNLKIITKQYLNELDNEQKETLKILNNSYFVLSNKYRKTKYDNTYKDKYINNISEELEINFKSLVNIYAINEDNVDFIKLTKKITNEVDLFESNFNLINNQFSKIKQKDEEEILTINNNPLIFLEKLLPHNNPENNNIKIYRQNINFHLVKLVFFLHITEYSDSFKILIRDNILERFDIIFSDEFSNLSTKFKRR